MTRTAAVLCATLALAAVLLALFGPRATREMPDFEVYWRAAGRAASAEPLYRDEDGHYQFKYLPAFAILARPLAALPLDTAKYTWLWLSVAALALFIVLSVSLPARLHEPRWLLTLVAVIVMAKFYAHELVLGQANIVLGAVVVGAAWLIRAGREAPAGALLALAIVIKPYAVIFLPWLAARRRTASIVTAAIGFTSALLLPALFYGWTGTIELHRQWWRTVTESTAPNLLNPDNVSIAAMYAKWFGMGRTAGVLAFGTTVLLLAAVGMVIARRRHVQFPEALEVGLLLTLMPLLSPQGWDYVLLLSTPAVVLLLDRCLPAVALAEAGPAAALAEAGAEASANASLPRMLRLMTIAALATIAFSLYDVMGRRAYARFMAVAAITVCYLVVVGALCALRMRRAA